MCWTGHLVGHISSCFTLSVCSLVLLKRVCHVVPANLTTMSIPVEDGALHSVAQEGFVQAVALWLLLMLCHDHWPCGANANYQS